MIGAVARAGKASWQYGALRYVHRTNMIDPSGILGTMAQVAVTLAGFAGVVVVFGPRPVHEWSTVDKFRLRLMLATSTQALAYSTFGLLLLSTEMAPVTAWRWSSVLIVALLLPATFSVLYRYRSFSAAELARARASSSLFYLVNGIGIATVAFQLVNIFLLKAMWPVLLVIVISILFSLLQFVRLIIHPHRE